MVEALSFRELQQRCGGVSSSVLNDRLAELREAGALEQTSSGYLLSAEGTRLLELYPPLQDWADRWARRVGVGTSRERRAGLT
jgi:DNA-binding HxlR family transcriptional regulator